jgi:hypothetical protein
MVIEFHDMMGFSGALCIIIAYLLLQTDKLSAEGLPYSLLNLIGALLILYSLCYAYNSSAVFIEIVWIAISLFGIYKWYKRKYPKSSEG